MVEDTITDGERIATVLRAEIDGRETAGLGSLAVREQDGNTVVVADGHPIAELDPGAAGLALHWRTDERRLGNTDDESGVTVRETVDGPILTVETGAAVKRAIDLLVDTAASLE